MKPWPFSLSVITPPLDPSITTSVGAVAVEADSDGCESSASIVPRFDSVTFESWDLRALSGRLDRAADLHRSRAASRRFALAHARDPETAIEAAILRGLLKPEETTQAWSVIDSVYPHSAFRPGTELAHRQCGDHYGTAHQRGCDPPPHQRLAGAGGSTIKRQ